MPDCRRQDIRTIDEAAVEWQEDFRWIINRQE